MQYVYNKKNQRVGVVVAVGKDRIGWSRCNLGKERFDRVRGIDIACGRAVVGSAVPVPHDIRGTMAFMAERANRYFKTNLDVMANSYPSSEYILRD